MKDKYLEKIANHGIQDVKLERSDEEIDGF